MKFRLVGTTVPAVEVFFEQAGEEMITQSGGMSWMSEGNSNVIRYEWWIAIRIR